MSANTEGEKIWRLVLGISLLGLGPLGAESSHIVVPNDFENTESLSNNDIPFFNEGFGVYYRYQQVYLASQFTNAGPLLVITAISFRADGGVRTGLGSDPFDEYFQRVRVNLSTTSKPVNGLSSLLQDNIGPDETINYDGSVRLQNSYGQSDFTRVPRPFRQTITFSSPFIYQPCLGNLLVEIWNFVPHYSWAKLEMLDTVDRSDATSRAWGAQYVNLYCTNGITSPLGLVTQFTLAPSLTFVPESSTNGTIFWPTTEATFVLEASSSLLDPFSWQARTNNITVSNGLNSARCSFEGSSRFFRLRRIP